MKEIDWTEYWEEDKEEINNVKIGDRKYTRKYAWFPVIIDILNGSRKIIWFKSYTDVYEYKNFKIYRRFLGQLHGKTYKLIGWVHMCKTNII